MSKILIVEDEIEIADLENISINTALGRMRYALINLRKNAGRLQITDYR